MQDNKTFGQMNLMTKRTKLDQKRSSNHTLWKHSRPSGAGSLQQLTLSDLQFVCFCLKHLGCQITPSAFQAVFTCADQQQFQNKCPQNTETRRPYEPRHTQNKTGLRVGKKEIKGELYLDRFPGSFHKVFPFLKFALTESELSRIRFHNIWAG